MAKRILVAEQSAVIRGVTETILRQQGYEVIAVGSGDRALEVLSLTRPDMIIAGSELTLPGGMLLFEAIQRDGKTGSIPLLLFRNPDDRSLPLPDEVTLTRPFEPRELLEKVTVFTGQAAPSVTVRETNPLGGETLDDAFLDAALGLDRIDVTYSEIMDKTALTRKPATNQGIPTVGMGGAEQSPNQTGKIPRVETLMIKEDTTSISARKGVAPQGMPVAPGTSKIEIVEDQYGMANPGVLPAAPVAHDYHWFVNEMKDQPAGRDGSQAKGGITPTPAQNPIQQAQASTVQAVAIPQSERTKQRAAGVEKFIDEFKREIEKFRASEGEVADAVAPVTPETPLMWDESVEPVTREAVGLFTQHLARELGERIAQKIVGKIDPDKLLILIKSELMEQIRKK